jgi:hypothetical protein
LLLEGLGVCGGEFLLFVALVVFCFFWAPAAAVAAAVCFDQACLQGKRRSILLLLQVQVP